MGSILVERLCDQEVADEIRAKGISIFDRADSFKWNPSSSDGKFSTKSAWKSSKFDLHGPQGPFPVWYCWIPSRIAIILTWRMVRYKLPTDDVLRASRIAIISRCHCCSDPEVESTGHIFSSGQTPSFVWGRFQDIVASTLVTSAFFIVSSLGGTDWLPRSSRFSGRIETNSDTKDLPSLLSSW